MSSHRLIVFLSLVLCAAVLCSCAPRREAPPSESSEPAPSMDSTGRYFLSQSGEAIITDVDMSHFQPSEDNNRVFYEIFVGSFSDSNGDGIGDLRGIINRMDYLNDGDPLSGQSLGVEGIWLTPIFSSRSYHKYDVADYYAIDQQFGTMEDLQELIELCHQRNVKLILDLPINHTSRANPMYTAFLKAHRDGDPQDPYYDFYCYYTEGDTVPGGRTWHAMTGTSDYVEGNFSPEMPELNFDNPAVRQECLNIAKFYLDMGVDGFRFDAAKYIYYGDNVTSAQFWSWYMEQLRKLKPDIYAVAEVWDADAVTEYYIPALNCFLFSGSQSSGLIAEIAKGGNASRYTAFVGDYLNTVHALNPSATIVPFIANHDTDRAAGFLTVASGSMQMGANLYILGPGSPFLYYGEEIGLRGSRGGANTDANRRLAMLWGDGDTVADPEGTTYAKDKQVQTTVADQLAQGDKLLSYYKRLLMIRAANPEIARGEYTALTLRGGAGGFTSTWNGSTVCVVHNPTDSAVTIELSSLGSFSDVTHFIGLDYASVADGVLTLGPQTSAVLR